MAISAVRQTGEFSIKWTLAESRHGFRIDGKHLSPIKVKLYPTFLELERSYCNGHFGLERGKERFGFYEFSALLRQIADGLVPSSSSTPKSGLRESVARATARALGREVHSQWSRLLTGVDEAVLGVHRALFSVLGPTSRSHAAMAYLLAFSPELYRNKFATKDICRYRAAAIAAAEIFRLAEVRSLQASIWVEAMEGWPALFSCTGKPYRALNRTLMNLPGGVPSRSLCALKEFYLQRPLFERTKLLLAAEFVRRGGLQTNLSVFHNARPDHIRESLSYLGEYTGRSLHPRRARDIQLLGAYLADCPEVHRGGLLGLTRKALAWHRQALQTCGMSMGFPPDTPVTPPPIPLPDHSEIRFLATVRDICQEGSAMQHCIASYAKRAIAGECFLFHVEYQGDSASVQIDNDGRVVQAQGPRNSPNKATTWGTKALRRWGQAFPVCSPKYLISQ